MSNQNQNPKPVATETSQKAETGLRGNTPHIQNIDESGFAPQGSVKAEQTGENLSATDFSTDPVVEQVADPIAVDVEPTPVALAPTDNSDVGFDGTPVDHEQVALEVEAVIKEVSIIDPVDSDQRDEDEEQVAVDIIADSADQLVGVDEACSEKACAGRGFSYHHNVTPHLVGFAMRLATLGIMIKNIDGTIDDLNSTQTKNYRETTRVSQMLWTAKIPSSGFGGMTGAQYIRSLKNVLESVSQNYNFVANFLIAPEDKSLDSIEDIGSAYEEGKLISLADAIDQRLKISKHQILIVITGKGIDDNALLHVQSTCDQNVEGFYFLTNTVEVIAPSLLSMTRYIAKLASSGKFAIQVNDTASFYTDSRQQRVESVLDYGSEDSMDTTIGVELLQEISEHYGITVLEMDHKLSETINPITTPSRLLDMLNSVTDEVSVERYSKVAVTTQKVHDMFFSQLGAAAHQVSFVLVQSWDIELPEEDDEDDE